MHDAATPNEEPLEDLSTPELLAGDGERDEGVEVIEVTAEDEDVVVFPPPAIEVPEDPAEAVPVLTAALAQSQAEAMEYLEAVQRVAAEFDNFRKRSARERDDIIDRASQRLIERLLPTLDGFAAALKYEPQTEAEENLLAGMKDIHRLLMEALAVDGFAAIDADGAVFDPAIHEAATGPSGDGDGDLIVSEMRRGYTLRGRVIRAALVAVRHA